MSVFSALSFSVIFTCFYLRPDALGYLSTSFSFLTAIFIISRSLLFRPIFASVHMRLFELVAKLMLDNFIGGGYFNFFFHYTAKITFFNERTIYTLPHLKCIRLVSVRSSNLPFKIHQAGLRAIKSPLF